jgi:hypothetical protein
MAYKWCHGEFEAAHSGSELCNRFVEDKVKGRVKKTEL